MRAIILLLAAALYCATAQAEIPRRISYQGYLTTAGGAPLNTSVSMKFGIYSAPTDGTLLYSEIQNVPVTNGVFNVIIGAQGVVVAVPPDNGFSDAISGFDLPFDVPYWLGVTVTGDTEMTPRRLLTASPYAMRATIADGLVLANPSTATAGNIMKGTNRFIHNFGSSNTFVGENAGNFAMSGHSNTAIGTTALLANATGHYNTASGLNALQHNTDGHYNTADGAYALYSNTSGINNTATGARALNDNLTGSDNTASGYSALAGNSNGVQNTAVGSSALAANTSGSSNTATGYQALTTNNTGVDNTAVGANALQKNSSGSGNTATGVNALRNNQAGHGNVANGRQALEVNAMGNYNTAVGEFALLSNTFGERNTAVGAGALEQNQTGSNNTAVGRSAAAVVQGIGNTAVGYLALSVNADGTNNTVIGKGALQAATSGHNNIAIGADAGSWLTAGDNNIEIGNIGVEGDNDTIRIGAIHTRAFIAGIRGQTTGKADAIPVLIDTNGQLGTISSSRRVKEGIADMAAASGQLMKLRPVTFYYQAGGQSARRALQFGLIAEEVAEIYPELVAHSADGRIETVMYQFLPPMLLNEYQKQQRTIEAQAAQMNGQLTRIAGLEQDRLAQAAVIARQAERIAGLESAATGMALLKQQMTELQATVLTMGRHDAGRLAAAR